jgi:hypothetical protein
VARPGLISITIENMHRENGFFAQISKDEEGIRKNVTGQVSGESSTRG